MASKELEGDSPKIDDFSQYNEDERPPIEIAYQPEFYKVPKKFGTIPVEEEPLGYDKKRGYDGKFPKIDLPIQRIEEVSFGNPDLEPKNRLFWGDNLHVMRTLPSESIDLIYLDPPFFSGKQYNVVFGDQNEVRSFNDIWDGGMPTYLTWLNARLLEMKRLLKNTGSIYVHLDWHASHYVKVEMDKIFGYENFRNEIVWQKIRVRKAQSNQFSKIHDVLLFYSKSNEYYFEQQKGDLDEKYQKSHFKLDPKSGRYVRLVSFIQGGPGPARRFGDKVLDPPPDKHWIWSQERIDKAMEEGRIKFSASGKPQLVRYWDESNGQTIGDIWTDIYPVNAVAEERLGYPTQKPESLLDRIIRSSTKDGQVVADFFCGGGTTPAVAQKLNRRWIAGDISRIAVEITKGRILTSLKSANEIQLALSDVPNIQTFSWGFYDISRLSALTEEDFKDFVIRAYGARKAHDNVISGTKDGFPVWVGPKDSNSYVTEDDVLELAQYLGTYSDRKKKGIMVAWQFSEGAKKAQNMLAELGEGIDFITIDIVTIGSDSFRHHVVEKNEEYANFLRFILPPQVRMNIKRLERSRYEFDFSESISLNGGRIINIQADFDFDGTFTPTTGYYFTSKRNEENKLTVSYTFKSIGESKIAFRIEDDQGGETIVTRELEIR